MTFLAGLGSAAGDLASSALSGMFGQHSAKKQMEFQERMSNTAYQRAAMDLEKAGLNRILAYGNPASTPSGASASMPDAKAGSSFQAGSSAKAQRNVMEVQKHLMNEQADQATTQASANVETAKREKSQTALNRANERLAKANEELAKANKQSVEDNLPFVRANARIQTNEAEVSDFKRAAIVRANPYFQDVLDWAEEKLGGKGAGEVPKPKPRKPGKPYGGTGSW